MNDIWKFLLTSAFIVFKKKKNTLFFILLYVFKMQEKRTRNHTDAHCTYFHFGKEKFQKKSKRIPLAVIVIKQKIKMKEKKLDK